MTRLVDNLEKTSIFPRSLINKIGEYLRDEIICVLNSTDSTVSMVDTLLQEIRTISVGKGLCHAVAREEFI